MFRVYHCSSFYPFSFGHCIVCPSSIYGFWLPLWYLQTVLVLFLLVIVLPFFLWFTASDYLFGIFKLLLFSFFWSLYCLSFFDLRLQITPLVSSNCCCSLSSGHCIVFLSLIYGFILPLWYLQTVLVLVPLVIVLPFFLWFTASDYPFGIFKLFLFSFLWSLCCLSFFNLQLLITPLVFKLLLIWQIFIHQVPGECYLYIRQKSKDLKHCSFNLICVWSVMLDSLLCSFTSMDILSY
jgi:hypothetical protein